MPDVSIDSLVAEVERLDDPVARARVRAIVAAILELHRAALVRIVEGAAAAGAGAGLLDRLSRDELVAAVLVLHGLHPVGLEARVREAAERLRARGSDVEVATVAGGVARLTLGPRGRRGVGASGEQRAEVERAILEAAPDLETIEIETVELVQCDFCPTALDAAHDHLVDPARRQLRCACPVCGVLRAGPAGSRWQRVRPRCQLLAGFQLSDGRWDSLQVPIGLAFFVRSSAAGRVLAFYPGPAGVTESRLPLEGWQALVAENPELADLAPDVEALLVHRVGGAREHYRVSIDECYRLAGVIRQHWRGLTGGAAVWAELRRFFADLRRPHAHA